MVDLKSRNGRKPQTRNGHSPLYTSVLVVGSMHFLFSSKPTERRSVPGSYPARGHPSEETLRRRSTVRQFGPIDENFSGQAWGRSGGKPMEPFGVFGFDAILAVASVANRLRPPPLPRSPTELQFYRLVQTLAVGDSRLSGRSTYALQVDNGLFFLGNIFVIKLITVIDLSYAVTPSYIMSYKYICIRYHRWRERFNPEPHVPD